MYNWYIGMDVVCIKTHSQGVVKEGNVYTIKSLRKTCCVVQIDIGAKAPDLNGSSVFETRCGKCKKITYNHRDNTYWIAESLFVPLDTLTDISEIEEILNQPIEVLFKN